MKIDAHVFPQLKSWTDRARQYLEALREPINKLLEHNQAFKVRQENKRVFSAYLSADKNWNTFSQSYFSNISMTGDALVNISQMSGGALAAANYGGVFIIAGAGAAVLGWMSRFVSKMKASTILEKRLTTKSAIAGGDNPKFDHMAIMDYAESNVLLFRNELRMAEKDLRIIQSSRHVKKMTDFYREVENAPEDRALAYTRLQKLKVRDFSVILRNLCHFANAGLSKLENASAWLDKMPSSTLRDALAQEFLEIATAFQPETRMLPRHLESIAHDHSIWSDIQKVCGHVESLKTDHAASNTIAANAPSSPTPPTSTPPIRLVSKRP